MKIDVNHLNNKNLRDFIDDEETLFEEEIQLERRDNKKKKKKILERNTKRTMRS